jgi:chemotaxis signal transduction protein
VEIELPHRPGRYLAIQVAGKYYALPNEDVREMMPVPDLWPLPAPSASSVGRGLKGFLHTQSSRIPIFDLHERLGGSPRDIRLTTQTRLVTVDVHGLRVGFYADRLTDIIQARAHEIRKDSIIGHGRPKLILTLEGLWTSQDLTALA